MLQNVSKVGQILNYSASLVKKTTKNLSILSKNSLNAQMEKKYIILLQ
jgi:hypothetical protein